MSFFSRLFKIGQSEAHSIVDKLEDPIKMTEQGIRDLRTDLQKAVTSLAEVKAIAIRTRKEADSKQMLAADFERKAMLLLQKMQSGSLDANDAERLATEALSKKESYANEAVRLAKEAGHHEQMANTLQGNVQKLKANVSKFENDLTTLKARSRTAESTKKINKQLANIDSSGTIAMLEKMRAKVEEDESLAIAYSGLASADSNVDDEINSALQGHQSVTVSANLLELKRKMGIA